ncbi:hypothetical protein [Pallidibacillus pasinlerensis]|uniref:Uncharacterized protein n=1 Tax=Pallidibacillus pasinlerensis TaxID=2703818 RepID=A0ABX0A7F0_9BACI|nr:hypothetical protein [Pallidibacillus pasinlerensis]NCU18471.1 hypothetical protein [Pallidibacillus pasinlerensis]
MLDFILENFPLIIVILGGLLSLIGGDKKKTEKQSPRPRPSTKELEKTPPFGSDGDPFSGNRNPFEDLKRELEDAFGPSRRQEQREDHFPESQEKKHETVQPITKEESVDVVEQVDEQLAQAERILQKKLQARQNQLEQDLVRFDRITQQLSSEDKVIKVPKVTRKNVTQGIIWSEVLGPPRSKKPYRSNVYQK